MSAIGAGLAICRAAPLTGNGPQNRRADASWWSAFFDFVRQPGVVETLLAVTILTAVLFVWWRLARLVTGAKSRQALADYLLGVEQALHGDLKGAHGRLQRVVETDPENHYARLLFGKVLAELGRPEEAHTQHLYLQRAFGVESAENELLLARSLLGAGMPREAAEAAERVLQRTPQHVSGWDFVYRARLQCGDFEGASVAGRRLLDLLRDGPRRSHLRSDLARTFAQAGNARLANDDAEGAAVALQHARRLDDSAGEVPALTARLTARKDGFEATVRALLGDGSDAPQLPAIGARGAVLPATAPGPTRLPVATFAGLVGVERWTCRACDLPLPSATAECARCGCPDPARLLEPTLVGAIGSPLHTMDAIDVNDAHVHRLVRSLVDGEGDGRRAARGELLELQERAVEELLRQAWHRSGPAQEAAIDVLRAMGPAIAPALFAASDALEQSRLLPIGSRSPAALVGRIVQGFDRSALPHVGALFASARPDHRKILIDFFLGLADLAEFQIVLERFPPLEIVHRLNKTDDEVIRRFLQALPPGHFVAESLLLEPAFHREDAVLRAIPGASHPEVLRQVLLRRGASRSTTEALIGALGDDTLADHAQGLLVALGTQVLDHVLGAYTDLEISAGERARLAAVLRSLGSASTGRLCASFGPEPTLLDDELRAILVAIGDVAVPGLEEAYGQSGWLERVSIGLISRHTNRRVQIIATLRTIGSSRAIAALRTLVAQERDDNLRLRLQQALHDVDPPEGGR
ncbi:MAG: hypothetical protein JNK78_04175 [Planctomycetes bacterium]|nr:hypothetical protein [Planctomycetota bacterium]